jgi:formamidopyrimidine-DNA glycosylase
VNPPLADAAGRAVRELRRVGKRIAIGLEGDLWLVLHLMIAGRLHWRPPGAKVARRGNLTAFDFPQGSLTLTEAGTRHRASLHFVAGEADLRAFDAGGIDLPTADLASFRAALASENHTLKRALTDPRLVSGIGNAYSDEILHAARLSPLALTQKLTPDEWERLFQATQTTLRLWVERLRAEALRQFPEKVTAFREGMAVHGRYGEPCPRCGEKVLRIRYADNETNYCARCQTGGKVLADRGLSRLLGKDWPRTLEELELIMGR